LGADGLCKRAFLLGNSFARSDKLDMCDTNVCNDADVGRSYFRQRRNFARVIHSDFPNRDFVPRRGLQNCSRQADMIIKISLCFRDSKPASENRRGEILRTGFAVTSGYCEHT
jgi:hypothetical protein